MSFSVLLFCLVWCFVLDEIEFLLSLEIHGTLFHAQILVEHKANEEQVEPYTYDGLPEENLNTKVDRE